MGKTYQVIVSVLVGVKVIKSNKRVQVIFVLMLIVPVLIVSGCASIGQKDQYADMRPEQIMAKSHITPSESEKLLLRQYLVDHYPDTALGVYAKAYMAYKNGDSDQEKKLAAEMAKLYPGNADVNHYQIFMGGLDEQLKAVRKGIAEHPGYLDHNFYIALADKYIENKRDLKINDFIQEIDGYEKQSGQDVYVFDYVRGMVERKVNKDYGKAVAYFSSALEKKGALARTSLWKDYFKYKYKNLNKEKHKKEYIAEVKKSVAKIQKSKLSKLEKNVVSHKLYKQLAERIKDSSTFLSNDFFEKANSYYYTIEVAGELRTNYISQKREGRIKSLLETAVKKLPNNPDSNGLLALEYADLYQYEKAKEYYEKAIKLSVINSDKKHYVTSYSRKVLLPTYQPEKAVSLIGKYRKGKNEKSEMMMNSLAEAYYYAGEYKAAKKVMEDFVKNSDKAEKSKNIKETEALLDDYIERSTRKNLSSKKERKSDKKKPTIIATTAVNADWVTMSPDGKHFLGNDGGSDYMLWDSSELKVVDKYKDVILDHDYSKYMTTPVYSPDGRYIAYTSEYKDDKGYVALIYDLQERTFTHQLPMIKKTSSLAWNPDGTEIAIWNYGRLIKYSLSEKKVTAQGTVLGQQGSDIMKWTADGKHLALLERSSRGSIRIYDADSLKQMHRLSQVSWPHALGVSKDGRYVFSADNRYKLHRWDTAKAFAHKAIKIPVLGRLIKPHPSKNEILLNDWSDTNKLITVDYEKLEITNTQPTGSAELRIHYIDNGKKILAVNVRDDEYEIYDSATLKQLETYKGQSAAVNGGAYANESQNQLVVWDQEGINVWSIETGRKIHQWKAKVKSITKDASNSNVLYAIVEAEHAKKLQLKKYDLRTMESDLVLTPGFKIDEWGVDEKNIILSGAEVEKKYRASSHGTVMTVNKKTNKIQKTKIQIMTRILTRREKYGRSAFWLSESKFKHVAVSPNEKYIAVSTAWIIGWKNREEISEYTRVIEAATGKEIKRIKKVGALVFKDNNKLVIANGKKVKKGSPVYSIASGERVSWLGGAVVEAVVASHNSWKNEVEFEAQNLKVKVGNSNKMLFKNRLNGKHVLTIVAKRNNEWIAYLPGGEYTASEKGAKRVSWKIDDKVLSVKEVEEKYKKEDVIKQTLRYTISDR